MKGKIVDVHPVALKLQKREKKEKEKPLTQKTVSKKEKDGQTEGQTDRP